MTTTTDHSRQNTPLTLVLGGTGKTGRRVVDRLARRGVPTRVGSRHGAPPFDWQDRLTWPSALAEVQVVYVSFAPDLAVPGACTTVDDFARTAVAGGVRRLVLLSGRGEPEAQQAEEVVRAAAAAGGAACTVVRSSWFAQNFSEDHLAEGVLAGTLALPVDAVPEPFVDADDIADVAVAALTDPRHDGETYEVTGPRLLTFSQALGEIAEATGRPLEFESLTISAYQDLLRGYDVPPDVVQLLGYLFTEVLDGRNAWLGDGVQRALGREPRDFRDWARDTAATGVWTPERVGSR